MFHATPACQLGQVCVAPLLLLLPPRRGRGWRLPLGDFKWYFSAALCGRFGAVTLDRECVYPPERGEAFAGLAGVSAELATWLMGADVTPGPTDVKFEGQGL